MINNTFNQVKAKSSFSTLLLKTIIFITIFSMLIVTIIAACSGCTAQQGEAEEQPQENQFVVMSTTDMHGKVWDKDLLTDKKIPNSFLTVNSAVTDVSKKYNKRYFLFDNGDIFQGTDMATYSLKESVYRKYHYISPVAFCLQQIRYDGFTLGNHEFNYDWEIMKNTYDYLKCAGVPCICANVYNKTTGQRVFEPYKVKSITVEGRSFRIAVIGLENPDCIKWDTADKYPDMMFHAPENPNADQAYEINKVKAEMATAGVRYDFLIVSMHSGFVPEGSKVIEGKDYIADFEKELQQPLEYLQNTENQAYRAIRNTTGIDMFITGHDHTTFLSNTKMKNQNNEDVLVVNGGGQTLTKSVFSVKYNAATDKYSVTLDKSQNVDLSDYEVDYNLKGAVEYSFQDSIRFMERHLSELRGNWDNGKDLSIQDMQLKQTDTMDFITRGIINAGNEQLAMRYKSIDEINQVMKKSGGYSSQLEYKGPEIKIDAGLICTGPVTANPHDGEFTMKELIKTYRFANSLNVVPMTGQDIKDVLEFNASKRLKVETDSGGKSKVVPIGDKYTYTIFYGINYTYDMNQPEGNRVSIEGFANGKQLNPNEVYLIATVNYLVGNTANASLSKLSGADNLVSDLPDNGLVLDFLRDYSTKLDSEYRAIYSTNEVDKNGEVASHWSIKSLS